MKTTEKAKELYEKCYEHAYHPNPIFNVSYSGGHTKALAIIMIDEKIALIDELLNTGYCDTDVYEVLEKLEQVKIEIERL